MFRRSAGWLARRGRLPTSARAVFGYYADAGVFDYGSIRLKRQIDSAVEEMIADAFAEVETAIAEEFGHEFVGFEYDTKLVLPAKLTLGYLYRRLDESEHRRAEELTRLTAVALVDGDMRDARNDAEFEDFQVDFDLDEDGRRRVATIAQDVLQERVEEGFDRFPDEVRERYDWAVEISERHQKEDPHFRKLMDAAGKDDVDARGAIRAEYKHAAFDEKPDLFTEEELDLPYLKTQYDRVGVLYDAMVQMYRAADLAIEPAFHRSIVLAIIGAQIWLDDVDDYRADMREGQLTPVTAEYVLAEDDSQARASVIEISERYLDRAKRQATAADSPLTGIATEYILRDGDPDVLPG